jgi:hypothetical protein
MRLVRDPVTGNATRMRQTGDEVDVVLAHEVVPARGNPEPA